MRVLRHALYQDRVCYSECVCAMRGPVLREGMLVLREAMLLRACDAMAGTKIGYAGTCAAHLLCDVRYLRSARLLPGERTQTS
eukprot:2677577-Rhodomonas_salina.2